MLAVLGGLADVERDLIRTLTAEGRSRATARGQHMGRPAAARWRGDVEGTGRELQRQYGDDFTAEDMNNLSLRKWLQQPTTDDEMRAVFGDVGREQNPRAAALGAAVMVEVGLSSMLRARLWIRNDKADDELFRSNGPIATFSQKIKMAEAIRIIGPATRANLDHIREIRNAFAHTYTGTSLSTRRV